jgi:ABC-type amino acid transport substrate-binding protein
VGIQEDLMARDAASRPADRKRHWLFDFAPLAACFALLISLGFLPPDTSSAEVDATGRLSVCMPSNYPPLVTGNAEAPGFEVELVNEIADRLGWRLNIVTNAAMGRDFNPRNWRINRAQCQMLAGGIVMSATTQSFLDTTRPHLQTGWALISRSDASLADIDGQIGFYAGLTGLDRIGLGQYLRQSGISPKIVNTANALRSDLERGTIAGGVTEGLLAASMADDNDLNVTLLGEPLEQFSLGLGFWKGDVTLQRKVSSVLDQMWADGTIETIAERYGLDSVFLCSPNGASCG